MIIVLLSQDACRVMQVFEAWALRFLWLNEEAITPTMRPLSVVKALRLLLWAVVLIAASLSGQHVFPLSLKLCK